MNDVKVKNKSNDKKYFVITPRIVWALSRNTYDFALWFVIKDIAGEDGECDLTTEELAQLAMMSTGKAHESREYLISVGLIHGEIENNLQTSNRRWNIVVPDLWEMNVKLAGKLVRLKDRVKYKKEQAIELKKARSCGEPDSRSRSGQARSPQEQARSCGESLHYNNNQRRFLEEGEKPKTPSKPKTDEYSLLHPLRGITESGNKLWAEFLPAAQKLYAEKYGFPFIPPQGDGEVQALRFFGSLPNNLDVIISAYKLFLNSTGVRVPGYYGTPRSHALWLFVGEKGDGQYWLNMAMKQQQAMSLPANYGAPDLSMTEEQQAEMMADWEKELAAIRKSNELKAKRNAA